MTWFLYSKNSKEFKRGGEPIDLKKTNIQPITMYGLIWIHILACTKEVKKNVTLWTIGENGTLGI